MPSGYIYILKNPVFGRYVLKIGESQYPPDARAKQIYAGATGVPVPFSVAYAHSVGDRKRAEITVHARLRPYRLNMRREFFRIPPSVANTIAFEVCREINSSLGLGAPESIECSGPESDIEPHLPLTEPRGASEHHSKAPTVYDGEPNVFKIRIADISSYRIKRNTLTPEQEDRARLVAMILKDVFPRDDSDWCDDFECDERAERELVIWEEIARAYMRVDESDLVHDEAKREAFELLLLRSISPSHQVLQEATLKHFTQQTASRLLKNYQMKAKPVVVKWVPKAKRTL